MRDKYFSTDNAEFWSLSEIENELFLSYRDLEMMQCGMNNPKAMKKWVESLEKMIAEKSKAEKA